MKDLRLPELTSFDVTEMLRTALSFVAVNMLWVFFALWLIYGPVPVLVMAVIINQMINRLEVRQLREAYTA